MQELIQPYLQIKNNTDNYFFAFAAEGEIRLGLNVDKIREGVFTYPTNSYDIRYML